MTLGGWLHQARAARAEERYAAALDWSDRAGGTKVPLRTFVALGVARVCLELASLARVAYPRRRLRLEGPLKACDSVHSSWTLVPWFTLFAVRRKVGGEEVMGS